MEILNEVYSEKFERFFAGCKKKIGKPIIFEPMPPDRKGFGAFIDEGDFGLIFLKTGLPPAGRETSCAHEILHAVQGAEGFPRTFNPVGGDKAAKYGEELGSLVLDLNVRSRLQRCNFDTKYEDKYRYDRSSYGLREDAKQGVGTRPGSYWFCIYSLRYAYLKLTQVPKRSDRLCGLFERYFSQTAQMGERIVSILADYGYTTPGQALKSMLAINDLLGQFSRCWIEDLRTGTMHKAPPTA